MINMDSKTKYLLDAAEYVIDQSMNPDTYGRDFTHAIINLQECVNSFKKRKNPKTKKKSINLDENDGVCWCKTKPCVCWHDEK